MMMLINMLHFKLINYICVHFNQLDFEYNYSKRVHSKKIDR